jgi:hypothetical protein
VSQEEIDSIMQEVDANVMNDDDDDDVLASDLLDPDSIELPETVNDTELIDGDDEDEMVEESEPIETVMETETEIETESAEEVLKELNNLTKYKLNKAGIDDLRSKGLIMLGENLQEERLLKIEREKRERAQIDAAVNHYQSNQTFRRSKRNALLDITEVSPKMDWEKQWDSRRS